MSLDPAKLLLGHQEAGPHPALSLIAGMPSFHIGANSFDDRESRLDDVGAGQGLSQPWGTWSRCTVSVSSNPSPRLRAALGFSSISSRCSVFSAFLASA